MMTPIRCGRAREGDFRLDALGMIEAHQRQADIRSAAAAIGERRAAITPIRHVFYLSKTQRVTGWWKLSGPGTVSCVLTYLKPAACSVRFGATLSACGSQ